MGEGRLISYQQEFLTTVANEIAPLLKEDWEEIEHQKSRRPLNPDWEAYANLELAGVLKIFTARDGKQLVGYASCFLLPDIHSRGIISANFEILFVTASHRNGFVGLRLMKFAEKCVKQDGAKFCFVTTTQQNSASKMMERLGYKAIETKFEKDLM